MPCNLTFWGKDFNADAFNEQIGLEGYSISRKGEPIYRSDPDGPKFDGSSCSIEVSKADFNGFKQQIGDVTSYLKENAEALKHISTTEGLEYAGLDFGVTFSPSNGFVQSHRIPSELIKLAAQLDISIELSMYAPSEKDLNQ